MMAPTEAVLLRVFVAESDRFRGRPLYEAIVAKALELKMAGATVLPGSEGFGHSRSIRSEINVDAGSRSPMVIEIVDGKERIDGFLPVLDEMVATGLVTLELVQAIYYQRNRARSGGAGPRAAS
jgi:PII-like signaling protein